eukprot:tig00000241_g20958.t1
MKRPSKRRRVVADAAGEPEQQAPASPIELLSDELLGEIFSHLQMEEAWRLRSVCKAWDQIIRSTAYRKLFLCCRKPQPLSALANLLKESTTTVQPQLEGVSLFLKPSGLSEEDSREMWSNALAAVDLFCSPESNSAWTDVIPLDSLILAPLLALRPPRKDGLDVPAALEELELGVGHGRPYPDHTPRIPVSTLRSALAPFSNLRCLHLRSSIPDWVPLGEAQAAVLAECCPCLTSLLITPINTDAVRRLAPLRLESLEIFGPSLAGSLSVLSEGEAGKTLKELRCAWPYHFTQINGDDLRSVARFPQLQLLRNFCIGSDVTIADAAALGAAPNLKKVRICHTADKDPASFLSGLTAAVRSSRSLKSLGLMLGAPAETNPAAVAGFITAASPALQELRMRLWRPLVAEEVAALASRQDLEGAVESFVNGMDDLLALEVFRESDLDFRIRVGTDDPALYSVAEGVFRGWCSRHYGEEFTAYYPKSSLTRHWEDLLEW